MQRRNGLPVAAGRHTWLAGQSVSTQQGSTHVRSSASQTWLLHCGSVWQAWPAAAPAKLPQNLKRSFVATLSPYTHALPAPAASQEALPQHGKRQLPPADGTHEFELHCPSTPQFWPASSVPVGTAQFHDSRGTPAFTVTRRQVVGAAQLAFEQHVSRQRVPSQRPERHSALLEHEVPGVFVPGAARARFFGGTQ